MPLEPWDTGALPATLVNEAWSARTTVGRSTSHSTSTASTVQSYGWARLIVATEGCVDGRLKYPVRSPGFSPHATRQSFPLRRARPCRNRRSVARCISVCCCGRWAGESSSRLPAAGAKP
jgi:hypothetical protein